MRSGDTKQMSEKAVVANRMNGAKSNDPKSEEGKRTASRNSYKHGRYARPDSKTREMMLQLGDDPAQAARFEERLTRAWQPSDDMQAMIVADLATLYAERTNLRRVIIRNRFKDHQHDQDLWAAVSPETLGEGDRPIDETELAGLGYRGVEPCMASLRKSANLLHFLQRKANDRECGPEQDIEDALRKLYGKKPQGMGTQIVALFRRLAHPEKHQPPMTPEDRELFFRGLVAFTGSEMDTVEAQARTYAVKKGEELRALTGSEWAPGGLFWVRMKRAEAAIDREIERKVKLLVRLKWLERWGMVAKPHPSNDLEQAEWRMDEPAASPEAPMAPNPPPSVGRIEAPATSSGAPAADPDAPIPAPARRGVLVPGDPEWR